MRTAEERGKSVLLSWVAGCAIGGAVGASVPFVSLFVLQGVLGVAQWLVLRRYLNWAGIWMVVSLFGWLVGQISRGLLVVIFPGLGDALSGTLVDPLWAYEPLVWAVFGFVQGLVFLINPESRSLALTALWTAASSLGDILIITFMYLGILDRFTGPYIGLESIWIVSLWGATLCALYGIPTGLVLVRVIQRAHPRGAPTRRGDVQADIGEDLPRRESSRARRSLWGVAVLAAALAGSVMASLVTVPLGLVMLEPLWWSLTFGVGALFSALCAFWTGELFTLDPSRGRLLPIVGVTLAMALIAAGAILTLPLIAGRDVLYAFFFISLAFRVLVALVAGLVTWFLRTSRGDTGHGTQRDIRVTAGLIALAILCVVGALVFSVMLTGGAV